MRLVTRLALCLALGMCISGPTRAGTVAIDPFASPSEICGATNVADGNMDLPDSFFFGLSDCKSLCGKAERVCKTLQKRKSACYVDMAKNQGLWAKRYCKEQFAEPALIRACELSTKNIYGDLIDSYKGELALSLAECKTWGNICRNTCEPT